MWVLCPTTRWDISWFVVDAGVAVWSGSLLIEYTFWTLGETEARCRLLDMDLFPSSSRCMVEELGILGSCHHIWICISWLPPQSVHLPGPGLKEKKHLRACWVQSSLNFLEADKCKSWFFLFRRWRLSPWNKGWFGQGVSSNFCLICGWILSQDSLETICICLRQVVTHKIHPSNKGQKVPSSPIISILITEKVVAKSVIWKYRKNVAPPSVSVKITESIVECKNIVLQKLIASFPLDHDFQ